MYFGTYYVCMIHYFEKRTNILTNNPAPLLKGSDLELFLKNDSNYCHKFEKKIGIEIIYDSVFNTFLRNVPFAWFYVCTESTKLTKKMKQIQFFINH